MISDSFPIAQAFVAETPRRPEPIIDFDAAADMVERFGSPLLVTSRSKIRRNVAQWSSAMPGVRWHYAVKANPDPGVLATLAAEGISVDVCGFSELDAVLAARFPLERILHTHPCKTIDNLKRCHEAGVRWFVFDNEAELRKIASHASEVNLLLRLAVEGPSSRVNLSTKFGAALDEAIPLIRIAESLGVAVRGLSFHVGTQCLDPADFAGALAISRRVWNSAAESGFVLDVLDIGGGFPAAHRDAVASIESFGRSVFESIEASYGDLAIELWAEPGRALVADATTLVMTVVGKSVRGGVPWFFVDDGVYGSFSRRTFQRGDFSVLANSVKNRKLSRCVVAGPTCDSNDVICTDGMLPDLQIGEILLVPTMGAYSGTVACDFNGCPRAHSVFIP